MMKFIDEAKAPISVKDAANDASNPVAKLIADKLLSGSATLSAPFPGMHQPWTNEKKSEFAAMLRKYSPNK